MTSGAAESGERFVRLSAAVRQRRRQVAQVADEARQALSDSSEKEPPVLELRGMRAILHDFYTGIEHIFETIAPELNGGLPAAWSEMEADLDRFLAFLDAAAAGD